MNADDLISYVSDAGFLFIFGAVLLDAVRRPLTTSPMAAAFFGGIAVIVVAGLVPRLSGTPLPTPVARMEIAILVALPWLLLRVASDFRPIPRIGMTLATIGFLVTAASAFIAGAPF